MILRDVLGFSAKEVAESLETTVAGVNGALLRARRAVQGRRPDPSQHGSPRALGDPRLREIAERFADAFERGEVDAILAMLAQDATLAKRRLTPRRRSGLNPVPARGCLSREGDLGIAEEAAAALARLDDALDTYERLPRGALRHVVGAHVGDDKVEDAEIIGYDPGRGCSVTQYSGRDGPNAYESAARSQATGKHSTTSRTGSSGWTSP